MPQPVILTKVPDAKVAAIKAAYEHLGATVTVVDNRDGFSTLTAVFPSSPPQAAATHAALALQSAADSEITAHLVMLHSEAD
jgi:hypothetical protein